MTLAGGLAVLAFLFRKFDWRTTLALLKHSSLLLVALSAATLLVFQFLRAVRWAIILKGKVRFLPLFMYSSLGTLISLVTAAQAGELVRPALVQARHGVPYFFTAASVAVERLLDIATLVLMGLFALLALPTRALGPAWIATALKMGGLLSALVFLILGISSRRAGGVLAIISKALSLARLPSRLTDRATRMVEAFLTGAAAALSPVTFACAALSSAALWGVNAASVAMVYRAVNRPIASIPVVLLGFVILSFGAVMPVTPGCVGQYEALWVVAFTALRVGPENAVLAAALLSHALIILTIALLGFASLAFLRRPIKTVVSPTRNPNGQATFTIPPSLHLGERP